MKVDKTKLKLWHPNSIDYLLITKDTTGFNFASGKNATGGKSLLAKVMAPMMTRIVIKVLKEGLNNH